jgi:hypothetical protein
MSYLAHIEHEPDPVKKEEKLKEFYEKMNLDKSMVFYMK